MSKSRWSQWIIAETATARIPMPWDRKTRIRHRSPGSTVTMIQARPASATAAMPGASA